MRRSRPTTRSRPPPPRRPRTVPDAALLQAVQAATSLVKAHRMHGHLAATLDPLGSEPVGDPALEPASVALTPELMRAHPGVGAAGGGARGDLRRRAPQAPRDLRGHDGLRGGAHLRPPAARLAAAGHRVGHLPRSRSRPRRSGACSSGCRASRRSRATSTRPSWARSSSRSRAWTRSCRCSTRRSSCASAAGGREVVIGMAHRGRLNVLAHTVGRPYESVLAEFEGEQTLGVETAAPEGGTGDVKYHYGAAGTYRTHRGQGRDGDALPEPEPPRVREPGDRGPGPGRPDLPQGARADARPHRGGAGADPRGRRLPGPGHRGRDAQPAVGGRLLHRRHAARDRQQPARLHHRSRGEPLDPLRLRPRQGLRRADHPRERRRRGVLHRGDPTGARLPRDVRPRRARST